MTRNIFVVVGIILSASQIASSNAQNKPLLCNGHAQLCDRRYNEVAYAAAHNGQSHKESEVHNQDHDITQQLNNGIRALKIHVWYDKDEVGKVVPFVCHGIDKKYLYEIPSEKIMYQVPLFYKPFAKALLEKVDPVKHIVFEAFKVAYGTDNSAGLIPFNHCVLDPAARPLSKALGEIRAFLDTHPHEVVTLIIEDHTKNLPMIADDFKQSGLMNYMVQQRLDAPWPTLREMIAKNQRLVLFVHGDEYLPYDMYPWMHYIWHFAWDTKWEFKSTNDFNDCAYDVIPHRGAAAFQEKSSPNNKIFIVHHFVTELMGGSKANAKKANKKLVLKPRLERLAKQARHIPNIIQVDFYQYPSNDIFDVVNEINGVGCYEGRPMCAF